jgi:thiamine biosynthesis lipoprotein
MPFILAVLFGCSQASVTSQPVKIKFEGEAQGTYYALTYYAGDTLVSKAQVDSLLDAFNLCASIYEPKSIISRFNSNDSTARADAMFEKIFRDAMAVSRRTNGAFDVTVGQLVNAWGFGFKNRENVTQKLVDSLLQFTGYHKVKLENGKLVKDDPRVMIDFNAIAQGFSVDVLADFLEARGITAYLIDIGGEVRASGKKPTGENWVVAIEKPTENMYSDRELKAKLNLIDLSLATSGNYRKYYEKDGVRYSHTIDPATGYPVQHNLLSASVIAKDCITADAYATAIMVMGLEKTKTWLDANKDLKLEVYCIYSDADGSMQTWCTKGFEGLLLKE